MQNIYEAIRTQMDNVAAIGVSAAKNAADWPETSTATERADAAAGLWEQATSTANKAVQDRDKAAAAWGRGEGKIEPVIKAQERVNATDMRETVEGGRVTHVGVLRTVTQAASNAGYAQAVTAFKSVGEERWVGWLNAVAAQLVDNIRDAISPDVVRQLDWGIRGESAQNQMILTGYPQVHGWFADLHTVWDAAATLRGFGIIPGKTHNPDVRFDQVSLPFEWAEPLAGIYSTRLGRLPNRQALDEFLALTILRGCHPGVYPVAVAGQEDHLKVIIDDTADEYAAVPDRNLPPSMRSKLTGHGSF